MKPLYKRILLKLSGEGMMGEKPYGIDEKMVAALAGEVKDLVKSGVEVAIVIGGGNIFRGIHARGMDRVSADQMGMLATVINAVAFADGLRAVGVPAVVMSGLPLPTVAETFTARAGRAHLSEGKVVLLAGGTGSPYFTTDTGASLRAAELQCDVWMKATQVDGVYSADPRKDASAERYETVTFDDVLSKDLKVMDAAAVALSRDSGIPVLVFSMHGKDAVKNVLFGKEKFTTIKG